MWGEGIKSPTSLFSILGVFTRTFYTTEGAMRPQPRVEHGFPNIEWCRQGGLEPPTHGLNSVALPIEPCPHMGGRFPSLIAYSPAYCQRVLPFSWVLTTRPAFARLDSRGATFWVFRPSHAGQFLIRSVVVISRVGFCSM